MVVKSDYEQYKSFFYNLVGLIFLLGAITYNVFTVPLLQKYGILPQLGADFPHREDFLYYLPCSASALMLLCGMIMWFGKRKISWHFNESFLFNAFLLFGLFVLLLTSNPVATGHQRLLRLFLLLILMFTLTNAFFQLAVKDRKRSELHPYYRNLALVVYSFLMVSLILEGAFMFVSRPHRYNGTLASRNWFARYWHTNSGGFRDIEFNLEKNKDKKFVLMIGDSFTAGHGIKKEEDRFGNLLQKFLPQEYKVVNLGYPGADTRDDYRYLSQFPGTPSLLVLAWYPNDIDQEGRDAGLELKPVIPYDDVPAAFSFFVKRSYLLNYLYWLYPRKSENLDYLGYLKKCYNDSKVMDLHKADLGKFITYSREREIPLLVILFPFLEDVKGSGYAIKPVEEFLKEQEIPVISLKEPLSAFEPNQLMVNKNDGHPNEMVHKLVADSIWALVQREGLIK